METTENKLGTAPVGKLLFSLALPAIAAQVINALYNIVDRIYIGRLPGSEGSLALAGLGIAYPLILIISAFASLVGMGGAPRASIKMGQKDHDGAERILGNSFVMLLILSAVLTAFFLALKTPLLSLFGATEDILPIADEYFTIYLCGTLFVQLPLGLNPFISAQGFAKTSMLTVAIGALSNIILDPILIFGLDMGVSGAAIATVASQFISAVWVMAFLCSKKSGLRIRRCRLGLQPKVIGPVIALGVSPFIMQATESLVQLALNGGMKSYGGAEANTLVGAMTIMISIMQFLLMPLVGLTQGAQPIISYNYGANRLGRVKRTFRLLFISSMTYSTLMWALCMLFPQLFMLVFTNDAPTVAAGTSGLRIFAAGLLLLGAQYSCQQTLVALGQAKVSLVLALLRKVILLIPLAVVLPMFFGVGGIYVSEPIADVVAALTTTTVFYFIQKKLFRSPGLPAGEKKQAGI